MFNEMSLTKTAFYVFILPLIGLASVSAHQVFTILDPQKSALSETEHASTENSISERIQFTVRLDAQGKIHGRMSTIVPTPDDSTGPGHRLNPARHLQVQVIRDAQRLAITTTDRDGRYTITDLEPGIHTLATTDRTGTTIFGINVLPYQPGQEDSDSFVDAFVISNETTIVHSWIMAGKQRFKKNGGRTTGSKNFPAGHNVVSLDNGVFKGKVYSFFEGADVSDTKITLLQDGVRVRQGRVDQKGLFVFQDLPPGIYDLVATGSEGIAAIRFVAESTRATSIFQQVTYLQADPVSMHIALAPDSQVMDSTSNEIFDPSVINDPAIFVPNRFVVGGSVGSPNGWPLIIPGIIIPLIPLLDDNPPPPTSPNR